MRKLLGFLAENGVLVALIVLVIVCITQFGGAFLQPESIRNLFSQASYIGIIAVGMTFVIMTAGIDLSVGSLVALCGAVAILTLNKLAGGGSSESVSILMAALAALGIGATAGFFNGFVIAFGRVAPFVVTLAGLAAFRSIALVLGQGGEIRSQVPDFQEIGFGGIPIPGVTNQAGNPVVVYWSVLAFIGVALLASFLLNYTRYGRYVIAVGANERAARYSAIDTRAVKVWTYGFLGLLVGLAAFFNVARMNSVGTGSVGLFYELDAIAAVVIGGTSLRGGKGRIWGTVAGALLLTLITTMMTWYRVDTNWQGVVRGVVILVAVLLQRGSKSNDSN
ncbi:MAG: ABC transporter permease [Fimbriimonadales bacterium]|nr:ABC transporter permease [Fimbriimonadales bacterium]